VEEIRKRRKIEGRLRLRKITFFLRLPARLEVGQQKRGEAQRNPAGRRKCLMLGLINPLGNGGSL